MPRHSSLASCLLFPENRAAVLALQDFSHRFRSGQSYAGPDLIVFHGPSGTGKSHLVQALINDLTSGRQIQVAAAADFRLPPAMGSQVNETLTALIDGAVQPALWILEDLHHLPVAAGEVLVTILERRLVNHAPTILTANQGPQRLRHREGAFSARLTSRLAGGLVVRLDPWQAPSRLAFLQESAQRRQLAVAPDILSWLASHLTGSGRPLEGAIEQLIALNQLYHPFSLATVQEHFQAQIEASRPTLPRIARQVSRCFQVKPALLQSKQRSPSILWPRQVGMFLARQLTQLSLDKIGHYFGGRHHSTVLHACRKVEKILASDPVRSGVVHSLRAELT